MSQIVSLDRAEIARNYSQKLPPWGPIGYVVYKRTYARLVEGENRTEEWWETVLRCCNGIQALGADFTEAELLELYDHVFNMRGFFSGRSLWQLGTRHTKKSADSLINCWFVRIDSIKAFRFIFHQLMMGGGVGFSVRREDVYQLPKVKQGVTVTRKDANDADLIVPDSREGWGELLDRTLNAFFVTGQSFSYSLHCIRSKGSPIKGFGGYASGPGHLEQMIIGICKALHSRAGDRLRSIECLDIANQIGACVVAGNTRRSAQIALGDVDDPLFMRAKRWDLGNIPNYRAMSNNTIFCSDYSRLMPEFWEGYRPGRGEAYGLFNQRLAKNYGRIGEQMLDPTCEGANPCAEITLGNMEACNLVELVLPRCTSGQQLLSLTKLLYRCAKTICAQPYWFPETEEIIRKNMRIGISVTGLLQPLPLAKNFEETMSLLDWLYGEIRNYDAEYSRMRGLNPSVRLTTSQPSGTKSLMPRSLREDVVEGITHGIHGAFAPFYIRRVRMSADEPLVAVCQAHGYKVEPQYGFDGKPSLDTVVVEFPVRAPKGAVMAHETSAIAQLDRVKALGRSWADNAVSSTVTMRPEELPDIQDWLKGNYDQSVKSISFMLYQEHGFRQAPYEAITEEQYLRMVAQVRPITQVNGVTETEAHDAECTTGACPIR